VIECKGCGEIVETEVCRYCEMLKDRLADLLEEATQVAEELKMNVKVEILQGPTEYEGHVVTWWGENKQNDYFNF